jgi:hypothetical protein
LLVRNESVLVYVKTTLVGRGVYKFFQTLVRLAISEEFSLAKSENNSGSMEEE